MLFPRTASWFASALFVVLLGMPASASAATPPVLESPASGASTFKEGASMKFEWRGALQGDPDTLSRSFFRVEIIKASDMPSGAQAQWAQLENFVPTAPGRATTEVEVGVPSAGAWRWRVCAWGVVDDMVANEIQQLPGGCSASRAFESSAVAAGGQAITELAVEERTHVPGRVETVFVDRRRPATPKPEPAAPAPAAPVRAAPAPAERKVPTTYSAIQSRTVTNDGSALGLGRDDLLADAAADRKGISGSLGGALGATLPLIPIPFWTLALLLACIPVARMWRGSVLAMFDWSDGSVDGRGHHGAMLDDLSSVPLANGLKARSMGADGEASAWGSSLRSTPAGGRRAA